MLKNKIVVVSRTFSNTPELVSELEKNFTEVKLNKIEKLEGDKLSEFISNAEGAIVALEKIDMNILSKCPNLKIIAKYGVGLDNINQDACLKNNVKIGWTGGVNKLSVAEMSIGFMLSLSRNLFKTSLELKNGKWDKNGGFNLSGKTVGIIGVGNVGKEVVRLLKPFNCSILVNDIIDQKDYYKKEGLREVSKEEMYSQSDIITLHVPLTKETKSLINSMVFDHMKPGSIIINTARGFIVDLISLKKALVSGKIGGAAIDVYDEEPPNDKELLLLDNLICTPHIGGNSKESVIAMGMSAINHLKEYFN